MASNATARLRRRIHRLNLKAAERKVASQAAEIKRLRTALQNFLGDDDDDEEHSGSEDTCSDASYKHDNSDSESDDDDESHSETALPSALWDDTDGVYRCAKCHFEVEEAFCVKCGKEHAWDPDDERLEVTVSVSSNATSYDRCLIPRGTTPVRQIKKSLVPDPYRNRRTEFFSLLRRGANTLMCETFYLEYSKATGIVAWADSDLYETFCGPDMLNGQFWKIYLGRCINLDPDDYDGSQFLEGILEDVLLFPVTSGRALKWETSEESPGIWATRPRPVQDDGSGEDENISSEEDEDISGEEDEDDRVTTIHHYQLDQEMLDASDAALEYPHRKNTSDLLIQADEYESEADEVGDTEMEYDSGWAIAANVPDAGYEPPRESETEEVEGEVEWEGEQEQEEEGEQGEQVEQGGEGVEQGEDMSVTQGSGEVNVAEGDENSQLSVESDTAWSDFDPDEVLSGDEGLGWKAEWSCRTR